MKAKTFRINSNSKHLLAAMWEKLLKIGFTDNTLGFNPKNQWHELSYISINRYTIEGIDINEYKQLFAGNSSIENYHDVLFNLPEDWDKVLAFAKEQLDDKYWVEENPLIAEAKRRYPSGTKFYPAHTNINPGKYCIVVEEEFFVTNGGDVYCSSNDKNLNGWFTDPSVNTEYGTTTLNRVVYDACAGKWAEIVKPSPKEWDVDTYVVFTKDNVESNGFKTGEIKKIKSSVNNSNYKTLYYLRYYNTIMGNTTCHHGKGLEWFATLEEAEEFSKELLAPKFEVGKWYKLSYYDDDTYLKYLKTKRSDSDTYNLVYYSDLIWRGDYRTNSYIAHTEVEESATLLTDLSEIQQYLPDGHPDKIVKRGFKVGEYIVLTESDFSMSGFTINHCYKIREGSSQFKAVLDDNSCPYNGYNVCTFDNSGRIKWRYATPEEIKEYNRLGKPYDVTTLNKSFILPEKWCIRGSKELSDWRLNDMDNRCNVFFKVQKYYYFTLGASLTYWGFKESIKQGYTEITFEQFMEYVVKPMEESITLPFGNLEFTIDRVNKVLKCKQGDISFDDVEYLYSYFNAPPFREILGHKCKVDNININIKFGCCHGTFKELETIYKEITK